MENVSEFLNFNFLFLMWSLRFLKISNFRFYNFKKLSIKFLKSFHPSFNFSSPHSPKSPTIMNFYCFCIFYTIKNLRQAMPPEDKPICIRAHTLTVNIFFNGYFMDGIAWEWNFIEPWKWKYFFTLRQEPHEIFMWGLRLEFLRWHLFCGVNILIEKS